MVLNIAPRVPGKWIQTSGLGTGQPTPEFYRFIASLTDVAQSANSGVSAILIPGEPLQAGALVNVGPTGAIRNANASGYGLEAMGFVTVASATGNAVTVNFAGLITGLSGLTPGFAYLGTNPGTIVSTAPSGAGQTIQQIGVAISASEVVFCPQASIRIATS